MLTDAGLIRLQGITFESMYAMLRMALLNASKIDVGEWHAKSTGGNPLLVTRELLNVSLALDVPTSVGAWKDQIQPNLPWAEEHFQERISGIPHNPPPSHVRWPWAHANAQHQKDEKFSHTYPERFWPHIPTPQGGKARRHGIRFDYGDLDDVIKLLIRSPRSRQAYLPVWFPEDTGAVHGERVPCTLGYHFLLREGRLQTTYYIRSCDFVRYFRDDVYMAGRLGKYVADRVAEKPGRLIVHIVSLHIMRGDEAKLKLRGES